MANPNWRSTWSPAYNVLTSGWRISTYSNDTIVSNCQTTCNNDLNACALGFSGTTYLAIGGSTSTCRCYECLWDQTANNVYTAISAMEWGINNGAWYWRDGWGMSVNASSDDSAAALVLRNGTLLPLSLCPIPMLSIIPQSTSFQVLSSVGVGAATTQFTTTCAAGGQPCAWQFSYSATTTTDYSNTFGITATIGVQTEEGFGIISNQDSASVAVNYGHTWDNSQSSSDTYTLSGNLAAGQTAIVQTQVKTVTSRTTYTYRVYGGIRIVHTNGATNSQCLVEDMGQELPDTATVFTTSADAVETSTVYTVKSG